MISTPLKGCGLSDCLLSSPRREAIPLKAVFLSSIPEGTPLKHLPKFQAVSAVREAALSCQMGLEKDAQRNLLQSTVLSTHGTQDEGFLDISEIKPAFGGGLGQLAFHPKEEAITKKALLKRKACEPLSLESPAKSSPRFESRAALSSTQNQPLRRELLDTKSTTDFILTPPRHLTLLGKQDKKITAGSAQKEGLFKKPLGEARVSQPIRSAANKTRALVAVDLLVSESPHKFFSRMKQMAEKKPLQQAHSSSHQAKENGPLLAAVKQPLAVPDPAVEELNDHSEEDLNDTCSQDDAFLVEATELQNDTLNTNAIDVTGAPDTNVPPAGIPQEKKALPEGYQKSCQSGAQGLGAEHQRPSQDLRDILATPKVHIPRRQKPAGAASKLPLDVPRVDATYSHPPEEVQQRIFLNDWRIKVLNDTAVILEGKRRDMNDIFWHSNAIAERIAHNQVKTSSGNTYVLEGQIDAAAMKREGMPAKFIAKFVYGIPKKWKAYVHDLLHSLRRRAQRSKRGQRTSDSYEGNSAREDSVQTAEREGEEVPPPNITRRQGMKNSTYEVLRLSNGNPSEQQKAPHLRQDPNASFTRSGRRIKPLLQYWCGERIVVDQGLNVTVTKGGINYLTPTVSSTRPQRRKNFGSPEEDGRGSVNTGATTPPRHQTKGGASKRPESARKEVEAGSKEKLRGFVSDSEGNNQELSPEDICRKQAVVTLTPLNFKKLSGKSGWPQRKHPEQHVPKERREMDGYRSSLDREPTQVMHMLRLHKQPPQNKQGTEGSSAEEDSGSSEDFPGIKRKTQPPFRREAPSLKLVSDQMRQSEMKQLPSMPKRTEDPSGPSLPSRPLNIVPFLQNGKPESPPPASSANDSPAVQRWNRQRLRQQSQKRQKYVFESESGSESSPGDFEFKGEKLNATGKRVNRAGRSSARSLAVAGRTSEKKADPNTDDTEVWTEQERQKLHRAVTAFPKHVGRFWLNVAEAVGSRSAEECQQMHMAEQEGRKQARKKSAKPGKKGGKAEGVKKQLVIDAKVGTLKRKQQMRDFLEQIPKDNHDDIFTATPFQNRNPKLPQFRTVPEEDIFQLKETHPITPSSAIFPLVKTPQCEHVSPGMLASLDRKDHDKHVYHLQKNLKGKEHTWNNVKRKSPVRDFGTPTSRRRNVFTYDEGARTQLKTHHLFPAERGAQSDEEDDEDLYFST